MVEICINFKFNLSMKKKFLIFIFSLILSDILFSEENHIITLPQPSKKGNLSLEETLFLRRSKREFLEKPLSLKQVSQLLWAAQGITDRRGFRTSPSAGATYPLEIYLMNKEGIFYYLVKEHKLKKIKDGDYRKNLSYAALLQKWVEEAPVNFIICADFKRTTRRYGERGIRYVYLEAGHTAQNILLQAVSLGLGAVPVGAFEDSEVKKILGTSLDIIYIIPVGYCK
jgi:SagB-type dehydrogenase family enzyme